MRRLIAVILGIFVALCVATPANAATHVDTIIGALQKAPVYVEQGTEGTTATTAADLKGKLLKDDTVVLVMLPADATFTQSDVDALAQQISNGLKGERIVGIAVGAQFAGAASSLPSGTADDLMSRAVTVSTNSVETLVTYVRNVHDWMDAHPEAIAKPKPTKVKGAPILWGGIGGGILSVLTFVVISLVNRRRIRSKVHYTAPAGLNDPVQTMMRIRERLRGDTVMYDAIELVCRYTEAYFKRFTSEKKESATLRLFNSQLKMAVDVIESYDYVYHNQEYVDEPQKFLEQGRDSIRGLAETILASIKKGNNGLLMDYKVKSGILDAQRYKNPKFH